MMENPVVLVNTGSNGNDTHVRWFRDLWCAERNHVIIDVSINGISIVGAYLNEIPDEWIADARTAHSMLVDNRRADLSDMATHKHSVVSNGPLVPIGTVT